jgi:hypothetical protein
MSVLALEILTNVESTAGVRLERAGDRLRVLARPGTDVNSVTERVRDHKPVLQEALLQREIVELACGPREAFDRTRFDSLYAEWEQRYLVPRKGLKV